MSFKNTKTALIILLVAGAVLQAGRLWFEESSGHNFFSSVLSERAKASEEQHNFEPKTIMVNIGDMRYLKAEAADAVKTLSDGHILSLIQYGRYMDSSPLNWQALLEQKSVIYMYAVAISPESLAKSYGETGGEFRTHVNGFDAVIIRPARRASEYMEMYAVDSVSGTAYRFETERGVSEQLLKEIDSLAQMSQDSDSALLYISSVQNSLDFFTGNVFLPGWQSQEYSYLMAYSSNPVEDAADFERCALPFFDNPVGIISAVGHDGTPFVSGRETVVKYYGDTGILEYTNYRKDDAQSPRATLSSAYSAAIAIMKKDPTLANDVVMTDAVLSDGIWTLYFDYVWGGARIYAGPGHAFEITVSSGGVMEYRRIVKNISSSDSFGEISENFLSALDNILAENAEDKKMDGLCLSYDAEENGVCPLVWFAEENGLLKRVY